MQGDEVNLLYRNPTLTHGKSDLLTGSRCWIDLGLMSGPSHPIKICNVYRVNAPSQIADSMNNGHLSPVCFYLVDQACSLSAGCGRVDGGATRASNCQYKKIDAQICLTTRSRRPGIQRDFANRVNAPTPQLEAVSPQNLI